MAGAPRGAAGRDGAMSAEYDVVVAGAGHNSLVAAAYLAKAGLRCLIVEGRPRIGGDTLTEALTLPGFRHDTCSSAHVLIQSSPTLRHDELKLGDYGLEYIFPDPVVHVALGDGTGLTQWRDLERTCAEFARFSARDAAAYRRLIAEYDEVKHIFNAASYTPVGFGQPLNERLAEHPAGARWLRRLALSAWDIIREQFEDEHMRAFLLWMAFMTVVPPTQAMSGRLAYSLVSGRQAYSWAIPKGGSGALPQALARLIEAHGGTIVTGQWVRRLVVEGGRCVGVECADGTVHRACQAVLSTIHIKHLVDMAPREAWGEPFVEGVASWQGGPTLFVTHYATTEPPCYATHHGALAPAASGVMASAERALRIEYDYARGAVTMDDPPLLVVCSSVADPTRAPAGQHTLKVIGFQPYDLPQGPAHWDAIKADVSRGHLHYLRRFAPNLTDDKILAQVVKSPLDLERTNPHNWHGTCHGGAQIPAQAAGLRPVPGWAQHRLPIAGLYQTGATTHPGGSVSAGPGRNAATVLLHDLGLSLEQAIGRA